MASPVNHLIHVDNRAEFFVVESFTGGPSEQFENLVYFGLPSPPPVNEVRDYVGVGLNAKAFPGGFFSAHPALNVEYSANYKNNRALFHFDSGPATFGPGGPMSMGVPLLLGFGNMVGGELQNVKLISTNPYEELAGFVVDHSHFGSQAQGLGLTPGHEQH